MRRDGDEYDQAFLDWAGIEIELIANPEDIQPEDLFDNGFEDEIADIYRRLENGDEWAWFCATVIASIGGIEVKGFDHLGGCSARDERDFIENGGYYRDMVDQAVEHLLGKLYNQKQLTEELF